MVAAEVPADGPARLGSVQRPDGRQLSGWDDDAPLLWATSDPVPDRQGTAVREVAEIAAHITDIPIWSLWLD